MEIIYLKSAIQLAGLGQLALVLGSVFIPKCLNWHKAIGNKLSRQLFWTYAGYILGMHLFFGCVSCMAASELLGQTLLANFLTGLMWLWWTVRIVLQFFCFDRSCIPETPFNKVAEALLVILFFYLAIVYGVAFFWGVAC